MSVIENNSEVLDAFMAKKHGQLSAFEKIQILEIQKVYGSQCTKMAIRFAKSTSICDIGWMAIQICGFREYIPASIASIIPSKVKAKSLFSSEKYEVACRLEQVTRMTEKTLEAFDEENESTPLKLWKKHFHAGRELTDRECESLTRLTDIYGTPFLNSIISLLPVTTSDLMEKRINDLDNLACYAMLEEWEDFDNYIYSIGGGRPRKDYIPRPGPDLLYKYFCAKAGRVPNNEEIRRIFVLAEEYDADSVICALSCIPSTEYKVNDHPFSESNKLLEKIIGLAIPRDRTMNHHVWNGGPDISDDTCNGDWDEESQNGRVQHIRIDVNFLDYYYDYPDYDENALESDDYLPEE